MKKWYDVLYAGNAGIVEEKVFRTFWDRVWALDAPAFVMFRLADGRVKKINKRWLISITEAE